VTSIGKQREGVGKPPTHDFDHEEHRRDRERSTQPSNGRCVVVAVRVIAYVRVAMPVM